MKLLSVSIPHHDANMSYWDGHEIKYIKLERIKQTKRFGFVNLPEWQREAQAIWDINVLEIDDFVFTFDPAALPESLRSHIPAETFHRLTSDQTKAERLPAPVCDYLGVPRAWFVSHHYSHALSTWMLEKQPPDVQIVVDGLGDGRPWSVYRKDKLVGIGHIKNGSIGWGIREAGKLLNVRYGHYNDIAGKVMGLQSYGKVDQGYLAHLQKFNFGQIKDVWSERHWLAYKKDELLGQLSLLDWVATVHCRMGELMLDFFGHFASKDDVISYSGGVAQNVIWNTLLKAHFPNLLIPPHASDEGLSLGGIEWLRRKNGLPAWGMPNFPYAQSDTAVSEPSDDSILRAAQWLAQGKIVGWYQGNGEVGPRALGNRSILMDPRIAQGKELINRVKKRENFRPFGASVLVEHYRDCFVGEVDEFMLYTCTVKAGVFPAITHIDGTCRVQVVGKSCILFRKLLKKFYELTGCPVLLNTSLNLAGKPVAACPDTAKQLFLDSPIDAMVIGNEVYSR